MISTEVLDVSPVFETTLYLYIHLRTDEFKDKFTRPYFREVLGRVVGSLLSYDKNGIRVCCPICPEHVSRA